LPSEVTVLLKGIKPETAAPMARIIMELSLFAGASCGSC